MTSPPPVKTKLPGPAITKDSNAPAWDKRAEQGRDLFPRGRYMCVLLRHGVTAEAGKLQPKNLTRSIEPQLLVIFPCRRSEKSIYSSHHTEVRYL